MRVYPASAELRGLELSAIHAGPTWTWRLGYSWSRASDDIAGTDILRAGSTYSFNGTLDWYRPV